MMPRISKRTVRLGLSVLIVIALLALSYEVSHWYVHVYASGARIRTDMTSMSSRVNGTIGRILVVEGDRVVAGQMLIELEDEDMQLELKTLKTDIALEEARRARLISERRAFELELDSKLATKRQEIDAASVALQAIENRLQLAERDLERVSVLFRKDLSSARDLATEQDKVLVLKGEAARADAAVEIARRAFDQVEATRQQLRIFDDQVHVSKLTTRRIGGTIDSVEVALGYRHIKSPIEAVIDRVYKQKGEYVEEGERILILHDPNVLWVEANIEESKIRHVQVGQSVLIHLEAQPFVEHLGVVRQIGSATVMEMGIATTRGGQFGRSSEHVPIQVSIIGPTTSLAPGMLASINIRLYRALPLPSILHLFRRRE